MRLADFVQTGIFTAILTTCVTLATCIISMVQGYKKMKIENFDKIYNSLTNFTEKRAKIVNKCNKLVKELANALPEKVQKKSEEELEKLCYITYGGINELLTEYSKCLELIMSFSHYLYKDKPITSIVTAECWSILYLYEDFVAINNRGEYSIKYAQIITLVQFIRTYGRWKDKKQLRKYLRENKVLCYASKKL